MSKTVRNIVLGGCIVLGAFLLPQLTRADEPVFTSDHNAAYTAEVMQACAQALMETVPADAPKALLEALYQMCLLDNNAVI